MWLNINEDRMREVLNVLDEHAPSLAEEMLLAAARYLPTESWHDQSAAVETARSWMSTMPLDDALGVYDDAAIEVEDDHLCVQVWLHLRKEKMEEAIVRSIQDK